MHTQLFVRVDKILWHYNERDKKKKNFSFQSAASFLNLQVQLKKAEVVNSHSLLCSSSVQIIWSSTSEK